MLELALMLGYITTVAAAVLFSEDVQIGATPITITTTTETIVATSVALSLPSGNGKAIIRGNITLTVGTGTTSVTLSIYRGIAISAGNLVGTQTPLAGSFTAGSSNVFGIEFVDVLSNVGGAQYCLSIKQTGASGNGTVVAALIDTKLLSG